MSATAEHFGSINLGGTTSSSPATPTTTQHPKTQKQQKKKQVQQQQQGQGQPQPLSKEQAAPSRSSPAGGGTWDATPPLVETKNDNPPSMAPAKDSTTKTRTNPPTISTPITHPPNDNNNQQRTPQPSNPSPTTSLRNPSGPVKSFSSSLPSSTTSSDTSPSTSTSGSTSAAATTEDDLAFGKEIATLRCPITLTRINDPIKALSCSHMQCFDRENFKGLNANTPKWKCPVCDKRIGQGPHPTNSLFRHLLDSYPDATRVMINNNGTHRPYTDEEEKEGKKRQLGREAAKRAAKGKGTGMSGVGGGVGESEVLAEEEVVVVDD
ncbi:hypothetical protein HDV00_000747 [Rhizophlyctis rosea]|nr:hypothetical protein HDV00_000747 [Rhizophlyctis rosea]